MIGVSSIDDASDSHQANHYAWYLCHYRKPGSSLIADRFSGGNVLRPGLEKQRFLIGNC